MKKFVLFLFLILIVITLWYLSIQIVIGQFGPPVTAADAGEMFGGINALFSGLAFAGVIFAVWLQTLDVRTSRETLQKTMESNKRSLEIMALSTLIQEENAALERYERWAGKQNSSNYKDASKTVREKLKHHREKLENRLSEIENL